MSLKRKKKFEHYQIYGRIPFVSLLWEFPKKKQLKLFQKFTLCCLLFLQIFYHFALKLFPTLPAELFRLLKFVSQYKGSRKKPRRMEFFNKFTLPHAPGCSLWEGEEEAKLFKKFLRPSNKSFPFSYASIILIILTRWWWVRVWDKALENFSASLSLNLHNFITLLYSEPSIVFFVWRWECAKALSTQLFMFRHHVCDDFRLWAQI